MTRLPVRPLLQIPVARQYTHRETATLFHALTEAVETLLDPEKRAAYDATLQASLVAKKRTEAMDSERRAAREALIAREAGAPLGGKSRDEATRRWWAMERMRDEERERIQALEAQAQRAAELAVAGASSVSTSTETPPPALRVKWRNATVTQEDLEEIFLSYGPLRNVLMSSKGKKQSALIVYATVNGAVGVLFLSDVLPHKRVNRLTINKQTASCNGCTTRITASL